MSALQLSLIAHIPNSHSYLELKCTTINSHHIGLTVENVRPMLSHKVAAPLPLQLCYRPNVKFSNCIHKSTYNL